MLIAWVFIAKLSKPSSTVQKHSKNFELDRRPAKNTELPKVLAPTVLSSCKRVRLPSSTHQRNINHANSVLQWLRSRSPEAEFPIVIATLRRLNPYVLEELLLTCSREQGWRIQRNSRYSGDGGLDGRVLVLDKLYLIQSKRYAGYVSPQHIENFQQVIQSEGASGGFFIHTGKTGEKSKQIIRDYPQVTLFSGQRLVDFVLGKPIRIIGITIPLSLH